MTSAVFQMLGKVAETKELLMNDVIVGSIAGRQSLITRIEFIMKYILLLNLSS